MNFSRNSLKNCFKKSSWDSFSNFSRNLGFFREFLLGFNFYGNSSGDFFRGPPDIFSGILPYNTLGKPPTIPLGIPYRLILEFLQRCLKELLLQVFLREIPQNFWELLKAFPKWPFLCSLILKQRFEVHMVLERF